MPKVPYKNYALKKMGQKCPLFSSTSLSDPPNMPKWCKNYKNMHKRAKLCIKMQKYAYKCKNANWGGGNIGKKCHLFSSTFLSDPPNMPKWCKNNQNMHKNSKLCIKIQKCILGKT